MTTGISSKSFIAIVKKSGVASEEDLNRSLAALQKRDDVSLDDAAGVAKALIEQGIITRWQADKMLQGRHKGFTLGQYCLLDMLGKGGMGAVYLAEHTLMRRRCAIKVLPNKNLGSRSYYDRFIREAQAVAAMDHPNIVRAYDLNQARVGEQDVHFLAMEYVEGKDLQHIIDEDGPIRSYAEAADYVRQAAEGLSYAHEKKMVHRDIKPANLLVTKKGDKKIVKILDLGLAKFHDNEQEASLTREHNETVLGTADYLAPEQAVDSHATDSRADLYSLGCTFYFLLTGHPPFCEGSVATRLLHHQIKPPPAIRDERTDCPDSLLVIIERMMAKKREERYQTAKEVVDDLEVWLVENGNEEWRERNPELVRKVGESWRADTKVVSGPLVDTAELDLKSDDDLSLAPLDGAGETPKESPLVSGNPAPAPALAEESGLVLVQEDTPTPAHKAPGKDSSAGKKDSSAGKPGSGVKLAASKPGSGVKLTQAPVARTTLPPLESADLVSLDDLQPLDSLTSVDLSAAPASNAAPLSPGLGTMQPAPGAPAAAQKKKQDDSFSSLPTWLIAGIAGIAVVVVLAVVVLMIVNSGKRDQTSSLPPGTTAPPSSPGAVTPPAPGSSSNTDAVNPAPGAQSVPPSAPSNEPPRPAETPEITQAPPSPEANIPSAAPQTPTPSIAVDPGPTPQSNSPPAEATPAPAVTTQAPPANTLPVQAPSAAAQTPTPANVGQQPAPVVETPAENPEPLPPPEGEAARELWAKVDAIAVKVNIPPQLNTYEPGLVSKIREVIKDVQLDDDAPAILAINYLVDFPKDTNATTKLSYTVEVKLTVNSGNGAIDLWRQQTSPQSAAPGVLVNELRDESAKLLRRMLNERKKFIEKL